MLLYFDDGGRPYTVIGKRCLGDLCIVDSWNYNQNNGTFSTIYRLNTLGRCVGHNSSVSPAVFRATEAVYDPWTMDPPTCCKYCPDRLISIVDIHSLS